MPTCKHRAAVQKVDDVYRIGPWDAEYPDDFMTDILTDLFHWARAKGVDLEDALRTAGNHYRFETDPANDDALRAEMECGAYLLEPDYDA